MDKGDKSFFVFFFSFKTLDDEEDSGSNLRQVSSSQAPVDGVPVDLLRQKCVVCVKGRC